MLLTRCRVCRFSKCTNNITVDLREWMECCNDAGQSGTRAWSCTFFNVLELCHGQVGNCSSVYRGTSGSRKWTMVKGLVRELRNSCCSLFHNGIMFPFGTGRDEVFVGLLNIEGESWCNGMIAHCCLVTSPSWNPENSLSACEDKVACIYPPQISLEESLVHLAALFILEVNIMLASYWSRKSYYLVFDVLAGKECGGKVRADFPMCAS